MTKIKDLRQPINFYGKTWIITTIAKEDLIDYLSKEDLRKITDDDMARIAEKMSDYLGYDYWNCLIEVLDCLELKTK